MPEPDEPDSAKARGGGALLSTSAPEPGATSNLEKLPQELLDRILEHLACDGLHYAIGRLRQTCHALSVGGAPVFFKTIRVTFPLGIDWLEHIPPRIRYLCSNICLQPKTGR